MVRGAYPDSMLKDNVEAAVVTCTSKWKKKMSFKFKSWYNGREFVKEY